MIRQCFTCLLLLASCFIMAQRHEKTSSKEIFKRYETKDSLGVKKAKGVFILFSDNTFINYGSGCEGSTDSKTIWYTSGRWLGNNEIVMCRTYTEMPDPVKLVSDIKSIYKPRQKFLDIAPDASFMIVKYIDYVFSKNGNSLFDKIKKLDYYEVN